MSSVRACPINRSRVDENCARLCSSLVVGILAAGSLLAESWGPYMAAVLALDYFIRGFIRPSLSPVCAATHALVRGLGIQPRYVNAAPKMFAAKLGFFFAAAFATFLFLRIHPAAYAAAGMFGACALLEAAFGFCVGCKIYGVLIGLLHMAGADEEEERR